MFYHPATQRIIPEGTAFELNGIQYPQNWLNLSTAQEKTAAEIYDLVQAAQPAFDPKTQMCESGAITEIAGVWTQGWVVIDMTPEQIAAQAAAALKQLEESIVNSTQARLDDFAKTRNYDGILSACTYAGSQTAKFASEGAYCLFQRDATWEVLYTYTAEVEAGTKPMPTSYADIEPLLPVLEWPV